MNRSSIFTTKNFLNAALQFCATVLALNALIPIFEAFPISSIPSPENCTLTNLEEIKITKNFCLNGREKKQTGEIFCNYHAPCFEENATIYQLTFDNCKEIFKTCAKIINYNLLGAVICDRTFFGVNGHYNPTCSDFYLLNDEYIETLNNRHLPQAYE